MQNNNYDDRDAPPHLHNHAVLNVWLRESAQHLFAQILAAESERFLQRFGDLRDDLGREAVVRNGYQPERSIETGIGPVSVRFPKLRSRTGVSAVFRSSVVPRYVRRTCAADRGAAWRYLDGRFCCDLSQVLVALLGVQGTHLAGLVPASVRTQWSEECAATRGAALHDLRLCELRGVAVEPPAEMAGLAGCIFAAFGIESNGRARLLALDHGVGSSVRARWDTMVRGLVARGLELPVQVQELAYTTIDAGAPAAELYA